VYASFDLCTSIRKPNGAYRTSESRRAIVAEVENFARRFIAILATYIDEDLDTLPPI
jgi:hypothetical protein